MRGARVDAVAAGNILAPIVAHIVLHSELIFRGVERPPARETANEGFLLSDDREAHPRRLRRGDRGTPAAARRRAGRRSVLGGP
jgi:hypothetical protein